jgi:hypothetical protein
MDEAELRASGRLQQGRDPEAAYDVPLRGELH